ncbi:helix-turn-helix domain-containing protein [Pseudoflavitalea sp. X16]|uniref:helix-turn-helix transcriptional regulator n=1 Tax=Paraflavitalea devenefica TaxID=2716334 RepID=UPI00141F8E67|nr:helix-turn-helix domain-containing protein [Paraflavitalea devenefica]NII25146.1 helix-turn-helix domain-containing protein [Paraflavitalea devenefica]
MSSNIRIQKACLHCKKVFTAKTTVTKFCSDDCAKRNYKLRMRGEKLQASKEGARNEMDQLLNSNTPKNVQETVSMEKALINVKELAVLIGISRRSIFNLMEDKSFPRIKIGRKLLFDKNQVLEFIKSKYGSL